MSEFKAARFELANLKEYIEEQIDIVKESRGLSKTQDEIGFDDGALDALFHIRRVVISRLEQM